MMWLLKNKHKSIHIELCGAIGKMKEGFFHAIPVFVCYEKTKTYYQGTEISNLKKIDLRRLVLFNSSDSEIGKEYFFPLKNFPYDNTYMGLGENSSSIIFSKSFFGIGITVHDNRFEHCLVIAPTPVTDDMLEEAFNRLESC